MATRYYLRDTTRLICTDAARDDLLLNETQGTSASHTFPTTSSESFVLVGAFDILPAGPETSGNHDISIDVATLSKAEIQIQTEWLNSSCVNQADGTASAVITATGVYTETGLFMTISGTSIRYRVRVFLRRAAGEHGNASCTINVNDVDTWTDAPWEVPIEITFDADMDLADRDTETFDADIILTGGSFLEITFDADMDLVDRLTQTFDADILLVDRLTQTFDADMDLVDRLTETFDADVLLVDRLTQTFDADLIVFQPTITFDADMDLVDRDTQTFDVDILLLDRLTETFDADMDLVDRLTQTFDADIIALGSINLTFDADMDLVDRLTQTFDASLIVFQPTVTFDADILLVDRLTQTFDGDILLVDRLTQTFDVDLIVFQPTVTFDADMDLVDRLTQTFDADIICLGPKEITFDTDLIAVDRLTETFDADVLLVDRLTETFDADMDLLDRLTQTFDADIIIVGAIEITFDVDLIVFQPTVTFDADMDLVDRLTATFDADIVLADRLTITFDADVLLVDRLTQTFDADMDLVDRLVQTFDVDMIVFGGENEITFDADIILIAQILQTFDAEITARKPYQIQPIADLITDFTLVGPTTHAGALQDIPEDLDINTFVFIEILGPGGLVGQIDRFSLEPFGGPELGTIAAVNIYNHVSKIGSPGTPGITVQYAITILGGGTHTADVVDLMNPDIFGNRVTKKSDIVLKDFNDPNSQMTWADLDGAKFEIVGIVFSGDASIARQNHFGMWVEILRFQDTEPTQYPLPQYENIGVYSIAFKADLIVSVRRTQTFDVDLIIPGPTFTPDTSPVEPTFGVTLTEQDLTITLVDEGLSVSLEEADLTVTQV